MKRQTIIKALAIIATPLLFSSCKTVSSMFKHKKPVVTTVVPVSKDSTQQRAFLQKITDNAQYVGTITSKIKFNVEAGNQSITLTGNLRMKRDDVIQLQLMAFGFVEAGRLEFTKDYVMVIDRINKQYIKANYSDLAFLKSCELNFYSFQALFWNELFQPGYNKLTDESLRNYSATLGDKDIVVSLVRGLMNYKWLADNQSKRINMAYIVYNGANGKTQLRWDYNDFKEMGSKTFPSQMGIDFTSGSKEVKVNMMLNNIGHDTDWETRTNVSNKYKQVTVDEILRRFMAL
jgi:hypothetical protein